MKKNEMLPLAAAWRDMERIMLTDIHTSDKERQILYDTTYVWNLNLKKIANYWTQHKWSRPADIENKLVVTVREWDLHNIEFKISYDDILYSTVNIANSFQYF